MSTKSVSRYKKRLTTQLENLHAISHFNTKHLVLLNYAEDFGNTVKELLKRTRNSKWTTLTKSRIVPCQILSWFCQQSQLSLPSVQTVTKEDEVVMRDWIETFRPV